VSPEGVLVGRLGRPHGLSGELVVRVESDNPDRFAPGSTLHAHTVPLRELMIVAARPHAGGLLVRFLGVDDRETAEALANVDLTVPPTERRSLEEGEYWADDLVGLEARLDDGTVVGRVVDLVEGAAQDRLRLTTPAGNSIEVPFVSELVPELHPEQGYLVIAPPAGLLEP
jgi:16S rRNA processing protein RimM